METDPNGNTLTYGYDGADRLATVTSNSGRRTGYVYDLLSRLTEVRGQVAGPLDPSITVNRGDVLQAAYTYTANSLVASLRDGNSRTTSYTYDGFDRLSMLTYPDTRSEGYQYDPNSNRTQRTTRASLSIDSTFDALNRQITRAVPPNAQGTVRNYSYAYNRTGLPLTLKQNVDPADVVFGYDTAGRLVSEQRADGKVIGYVLDADGNRTGLIWPEAGASAYLDDDGVRRTGPSERDPRGRGHDGASAGRYSYDTASRRLGMTAGNGVATSYAWRPGGQVQQVAHQFAGGASVAFTYLYNTENALWARTVSDAAYQAAVTNPD